MGFFKGLGIVIFSIFLFLSLLIGGICLTLGMSLSYNNVQPTVLSISNNVISQSIDVDTLVSEASPLFQEYCKTNIEYTINEGGQTIVIPCSVINQGDQAIINYLLNDSVKEIVEDYYYKQYDCNLVKCIENGEVTALISKQARDYWMSKSYLFLGLSIIFIILLFFLLEKKSNWFFLIGSLFVLDSLIISKLNVIGTWIARNLLLSIKEIFSGEISKDIISQVVSLFFIESRTVFYIMLGIGIILFIIGIIFAIFKIGVKVVYVVEKIKKEEFSEGEENVSKEDVQEIVKKEVKQKVKEELLKNKNNSKKK